MYSNIRLLDCINRPKALIDKAREMGLSGIMITDHECLSAHMEVNQYAKKLQEIDPDFTVALGNEIYLTDTRDKGQKYYHFILGAKDAYGHKGLRELSSIAWYNSYEDRRMERVPLLKSELREVMSRYKGHIVATSACMGGELSTLALALELANDVNDMTNAKIYYDRIVEFLAFCKDVFGDDFYIECAPSENQDQIIVNHKLYKIAKAMGMKMVVGTDAHYLTKEDRPVHKAYLNSKGGEREVDAFYEFSRLMDTEEVANLLIPCFLDLDENPGDIVNWIMDNTEELRSKFTFYSLERKQMIPKVSVKDYPKSSAWEYDMFPVISSLLTSDEIQERYWINECLIELGNKGLDDNIEYVKRLEIEADIIKYIGEQLNDCLFAYFNTFKHYIDLFWECGSIVGPGRGSATGFLSNYLLGITQLDPIRWNLPYWRFLNKERAELPDIDIDLAPSKRPGIFKAIRKERGELGLVQVATFGTEGTKSAVLTACRGYRSEEYPEGIDVDEAQYMSSLIPQERGFLWPIADVIHGNDEKNRKPVNAFIREVNQYPGLLDIIESIEGLVNKRSSHASGVILYGDDPYETAAFMRTPSGDLITCYDLHKAEAAGDTKYDFLVTEVSDKIIKCFELLTKDKVIENDSLRQLYNKYLHPEIIDTTNQKIWDHLAAGDILDVFQFSTGVGLAIAKRLKPQDPMEMTAANAMMRLMSEKGVESQQDRYVRIQSQGIQAFDAEMRRLHLSEEFIKKMHKHCDKYYGCCPIQEQMMEMLMDIAGFTLGEANNARKIVAKKQMSKIPELREQVWGCFDDQATAKYFWDNAIAPQLGYAFSMNHSLPYSFVGIQTICLAINFNPIYWDTACLIVNSGATDEEAGGSTDYGKIAKAIGDIMSAGIKVSLANINKSDFGFAPDVENNRILFGLKGMLNVGDDIVANTIANRPYVSPRDFLNKVRPGKQAMISLIKGGAFDEMMDRKLCMGWYIWETCDKKKRITLQNMSGLIRYGVIPTDDEKLVTAKRIFEFNRYLKAVCKSLDPKTYYLDERGLNFIMELGYENLLTVVMDNYMLDVAEWEKKVYQPWMDVVRNWIASDKEGILNKLNTCIFKEDWDKYAQGTLSAWEMEVLCFYYHDHELKNVNMAKYGLSDFHSLPEEPVVERTFTSRAGTEVKIFKIFKICGTCIAKNKTKGTVTLLTNTGVVEVKFRKEYFSLFDKQISEKGADGVKHVVQKSWFNRGNMIVVQGIRSGDDFIAKKYQSTGGHQLYRIEEIKEDGSLILADSRPSGNPEDEID
jgi:DNA polymerase-3 subunit alpha